MKTKKTTTSHEEDYSDYKETVNPLPVYEMTKQEVAAEKAQAKIAAKAEKAAVKAEKEAARLVKVQASNHSTKEERDAAKADRAARFAALDPNGTRKYTGSMLALADRVKQGVYVKGATGQLHSVNELATLLDEVPVSNVIQLAKIVLGMSENPYTHLNAGQQSMNLRNKLRGAITKGTLTLDTIRGCIVENDFATAGDWKAIAEAKTAARAVRAEEAKAKKAATSAAHAILITARVAAKEQAVAA